ncbi:MAG: hypothetical protein FWG70_00645 [Oscillospiraceae bacterium]|nr:hypothetical protein [Oscillospiraceae bacterium]
MKFFKKTISLLLTLAIALSLVAGCSETLPPALSDGETENTEPENLIAPDEEEGEEDNTPIYIVGQQMTLDLISEMNDGVMPETHYHDDGTIERILYPSFDFPDNSLSPFPVFTEDDAIDLINSYSNMLGIDEEIDIRFNELHSMQDNIFSFSQYYKDIRINGAGVTIRVNKETGHVLSVNNLHIPNPDIETTPIISMEEAKQIAMLKFDFNDIEDPKLIIYYNRDSGAIMLAWEFNLGLLSAVTGNFIYTQSISISPF